MKVECIGGPLDGFLFEIPDQSYPDAANVLPPDWPLGQVFDLKWTSPIGQPTGKYICTGVNRPGAGTLSTTAPRGLRKFGGNPDAWAEYTPTNS